MPLDALGRTRATMPGTAGVSPAPTGAGNPLKASVLASASSLVELHRGVLGPGTCNSFPPTRNA
jgi:hypothetical protein